MPLDERRDRMLPLHERVLRNDVFAWGDRFLNALKEAAETRRQKAKGTPALLPVDRMQSSYRQSSKRLLLLDYDGTLAPFTADPREAVPDDELRTLLAQLFGLIVVKARYRGKAVSVYRGTFLTDCESYTEPTESAIHRIVTL